MSTSVIESFKKGIHALDTSPSEEQIFFGFIRLKYEIQRTNFYGMLICNLLFGFCLSGAELMQQNLLLSSEYFNFDSHTAAQYNSYIIFQDILTRLLVTPLYGNLIDKYGRRIMAMIGFGLIFFAFLIFTPSHFPDASLNWYYFVRFIYANGTAIISGLPFIADYIDHDSKGRAIGISGLITAIGFSLSTLVVAEMANSDLYYTYLLFVAFVVLAAPLSTWLLKPGNLYYKTAITSPDKHIDVDDDFITNLQESNVTPTKKQIIVQACRSRPWIIVAYIFGFVNGICFAITLQIFNLYSQSFGILDAKRIGSSFVLKCNIAAVLTSLVVGPALDFVKSIYVSSVAFALNIAGFFFILTVEDPYAISLSLIAIIFGMAYAVSQLLTNYLGFKHYPTSMRGLFFSIANICSLLGLIPTTVVGGLLFNSGDRNWPFYMAGLCSLISLCAFVYVYLEKIIPTKKKIQNKQELNLSLLYTSISNTQQEAPIIDIDDTKLQLDG